MDQIKIGKFIAEMRKEQNLTQIDLAEKLGISNKTISKWECGNGMPDYAVMEGLCDILQINVNELLSGERLPSKDYNKKAEENMMSLIQESSENYKRENRELILVMIGVVAIFLIVIMMIVMWGGVAAIGNFIDLPTFTYMLVMTVLVVALSGMLKDFIKAFPIAIKRGGSIHIKEIQRSMLAVKTTIIVANIVSGLSFCIALVSSLKAWVYIEMEPEPILIWTSVAFLSVVYSLVSTLILIPIYMRLKRKLIEE